MFIDIGLFIIISQAFPFIILFFYELHTRPKIRKNLGEKFNLVQEDLRAYELLFFSSAGVLSISTSIVFKIWQNELVSPLLSLGCFLIFLLIVLVALLRLRMYVFNETSSLSPSILAFHWAFMPMLYFFLVILNNINYFKGDGHLLFDNRILWLLFPYIFLTSLVFRKIVKS
ncbi:hypothetical protein HYV86_03505 [Candidatus Woesearchaeota archaeon]|nr:hypothetical protein [Candidatus Woesearchaeota archaeon]